METTIKLQTLQQIDQDGNILQSYQVLNPKPFEDGNGYDYSYPNGKQGWAWNEDGKKWEIKPIKPISKPNKPILIEQFKGFNFWAKRLDKDVHIIDNNSKQVGGGVMCGKYGALLGHNYAGGLNTVCPDCVKAYHKSQTN